LAVAPARAATAQGIAVFTIGLGNQLDFDALEWMARRPNWPG